MHIFCHVVVLIITNKSEVNAMNNATNTLSQITIKDESLVGL